MNSAGTATPGLYEMSHHSDQDIFQSPDKASDSSATDQVLVVCHMPRYLRHIQKKTQELLDTLGVELLRKN